MTWDDHEFENNYADLDLDPNEPLETVARAPRRRVPRLLGARAAGALAQARRQGHAALPPRALGQRSRRSTCSTRASTASDQIAQCTPGERTPPIGLLPGRARSRRARSSAPTQRDWLLEGLATAPGAGLERAGEPGRLRAAGRPRGGHRRRFSVDPWDGYVADRQRILDFLAKRARGNTVVITGDAHAELRPQRAAESYSSIDGAADRDGVRRHVDQQRGRPDEADPRSADDADNPHILWQNNKRGYVRVELEPAALDDRVPTVVRRVHRRSRPTASIARPWWSTRQAGRDRAGKRSVARVTRRLRREDETEAEREDAAARPPAAAGAARAPAQRRQRRRRARARARARVAAVHAAGAHRHRRQPAADLPAEARARGRDAPSTASSPSRRPGSRS